MSNTLTIMSRLQADNLLQGSYMLTQIETLKTALRYRTGEGYISFDDHFLFLQAKIDQIKRIVLIDQIPAQQGARYENELLCALEETQDQIEKWTVKTIKFQGDLARAKADIQETAAAFESWYVLGALDELKRSGVDLPKKNVQSLASSEFSRLMDRTNLSIDALIEAVKIELKRLDSKQKMAKQKFDMGRAQVEAAWSNRLPESLGISPTGPIFDLLSSGVEDEDEVPAFVSRETGAVVRPVLPEQPVEVLPVEELEPTGSRCSVCNLQQFHTPGGECCANGHGGAPAAEEPVTKPFDFTEVRPVGQPFLKVGTPVPVTIINAEVVPLAEEPPVLEAVVETVTEIVEQDPSSVPEEEQAQQETAFIQRAEARKANDWDDEEVQPDSRSVENKHTGSTFDSFLEEEGLRRSVDTVATERVSNYTASHPMTPASPLITDPGLGTEVTEPYLPKLRRKFGLDEEETSAPVQVVEKAKEPEAEPVLRPVPVVAPPPVKKHFFDYDEDF